MPKILSESRKTSLFGIIVGVCDFAVNVIITNIPSHVIRVFLYSHFFNISIGKDSTIHMGVKFSGCVPKFIQNMHDQIGFLHIGNNCSIGNHGHLDIRGKIIIGNNVSISPHVFILTADHNPKNLHFTYQKKQVLVDDYVWVATRANILPGVTLHEGATVGAGSTVTKDVCSYTIVAGCPAKEIGTRPKNLEYCINYRGLLK